ncbi:MAG: hypothetical protein V4662_12125 [Verrucomicrobiota bacterium]
MTLNGSAQQLCEDLGWSVESLTRRNLAADVLMMRKMHSGARTLVQRDAVVIFADGLRIFTGTVHLPKTSLMDSSSTIAVQIVGPWQVLAETTFVRGQPRYAGSGATATCTVSGGAINSVTVTAPGSGYLEAHVLITGAGVAARLKVNLSTAGAVTSITILAGGNSFGGTPPTLQIVGLTQLPPLLGDTFSVAPGEGVEIYDPATGIWAEPVGPTTYKWARQDNFAATPKEVDLARYTGTRGLICDPNWDSFPIYRTLQAEVRHVLRYFSYSRAALALVDRPDLTPAFAMDLDGIETGLGTAASPRYRTWSDQRTAGLLASLLAVKPDVASWFDYSLELPELHMRVASLETEQLLNRGDAPLVSVDAVPRPELKPDGVVIRWEYTPATEWYWRGYKNPAHVDKSPVTVLPHEPGVLTHTLNFSTAIAEFKPSLAASLMASMGILRATGTLMLGAMTLEEAMAVRPGRCYRLPNDETLADSQLLVQETVWNARSGQVSCTLGYPPSLDLTTVSDLQGWITMTYKGFMAERTDLVPPPGP